jgi:carbamoyltransferase
VQPASGDSGGALGAAQLIWNRYLNQPRTAVSGKYDSQSGSLLGTSFTTEEIRDYLKAQEAVYREVAEEQLVEETAQLLNQGAIIGWFQGRMEFGPRALGNRSILADPRQEGMKDKVNLRIKFRESFRPFAPVVLEEECADYFDLKTPSPYMLFVAPVLENRRQDIPAVTHVDGSARIQTVNADENPLFFQLLTAFRRESGSSVLLNTSFNVRGDPIVESPAQAYECFMRTGMDTLVIDRCLLKNEHQPDGL